ncbi:cation channel sperm-associated protein 1 isoform X6 [Equus przewalskii]|uniref:Cation channel sperm-associated protein 1 isoform X6 n=1 Tax=Equus przewalskii TaxID=9798 RepID=A0ABM4K0C2_EQUPR
MNPIPTVCPITMSLPMVLMVLILMVRTTLMMSITMVAGESSMVSPTTMGDPTGVSPTTMGDPTGVSPTTMGDPTGVSPTTVGDPTGVSPTTVGDPTVVSPTTVGGRTTMVSPTSVGGPTTMVGPISMRTPSTMVNPTTVEAPITIVRPITMVGPIMMLLTTTAGTLLMKPTTTEGLFIMERPIPTIPTWSPTMMTYLATLVSTTVATTMSTTTRSTTTDSSSKSSESWAEEDEQFQKRKAGRTQRPHKKLHTLYLCYWLWEKLSYFIQDLRRMLRNLIESLAFEAFIFLVVCLNTIMLVVQTFAEVEIRGEWYFMALDSIFLCIYVVEALLKIMALGVNYFYNSWNNLDFFIMVMAVLDFMLMQLNYLSSRTFYHQSFRIFKVFKSLRALRAIRVLRRLSFLTSLQEVTGTLARSLPSITAILILMFTCLFLFSVVLRALFRQSDPKRFQNIFTTIFTLFTLLTLDDWSLIYLDSRAQGAWHIIPILMIYIIIQYFIFLNLVIAVLVDNFQMALLRGLEKVKQERAAWIHEKLLDDSLTELRKAEPVEEMSEHTKQKQLMEKKFGTMTEKQQEVLFHFLQLVAGVEHYQQKFRSQASVIDEIVDTTFEAGEEDFRK